ncbi:MAG: hypothetical protein RMJ67_06610 [Elusimicrobiota bacterium]|nr:hypothetical protein [Endomicrobiia bacterium]MDW8166165.1 hypothetical protein [Elusimicrobiota bacterium]
MFEEKDKTELELITQISEISIADIVKYALISCLRSREDVGKFALSVRILESLIYDDLEKQYEALKNSNKEEESYFYKVSAYEEKLKKELGTREEVRPLLIQELSIFKFRELIKFIKGKLPVEVVAEI